MRTFLNNELDDEERSQRSRFIWIISGVALVLVVTVLVIILTRGPGHYPKADQGHGTTFQGMSSFIQNGLTTDQVNGLIKDFSKFSSSAKTVSVDPTSLIPGPHNPNSGDPSFTITFRVSIDSASYRGSVVYSGLSAVRLILYNNAGKSVFDSGATS